MPKLTFAILFTCSCLTAYSENSPLPRKVYDVVRLSCFQEPLKDSSYQLSSGQSRILSSLPDLKFYNRDKSESLAIVPIASTSPSVRKFELSIASKNPYKFVMSGEINAIGVILQDDSNGCQITIQEMDSILDSFKISCISKACSEDIKRFA